MKQYIIDAFTDKAFSGNPAAVCIVDSWPDNEWLLNLARENNLSETAFLLRNGSTWHLRWFTPETEIELCGHATLASAFAIMNFIGKPTNEVYFQTKSGILYVTRNDDLYKMDFPQIPQNEIPVTQTMADAFGVRPVKAFLGLDLMCIFENENVVNNLQPNQNLLATLDGRGQHATARGQYSDCVSRSFFPKIGIPEDPVCGSAHCQIAPYWGNVLGKNAIIACQASGRGGFLFCNIKADSRIEIGGKACLISISEIQPDAWPNARDNV